MNTKILDHGMVRLVESMGSDISIVRNARVSYNGEMDKETPEKTRKLINYLMVNKHTSPFESVSITFEVKAPIFVLRQWHRHRTWSYNEISARYAELPEEFYIPTMESIGKQSKSNKQMRIMEIHAGVDEVGSEFIEDLQEHSALGFSLYRAHLEKGTPRELARLFLGLNTYSHMFATVDLHNLFHFLRLRLHNHSQYEIQEYARGMLNMLRSMLPITTEAFISTLTEDHIIGENL